ncbi:uncharacterized protein LOC109706917 [Ananas comosus]|uniref:Uncharacterized protein LOC109706917 n=2 Tax=Ananas comosus TaxID=4615 RepID=A0A6P5EMG2_ANACO|nr:uncharacterized protein LOC109706917 [Ananas comosus]XP_020084652.1 uncharacterized protein LOC109706917 [Ananas comosus]
MSSSSEQARKAYAEFEEKVKRTVLLENLSPHVTASVIKTAVDQFGTAVNVEFIPNYTLPYNIPQAALVEMEDPKHVDTVISMMTDFPFMMSGMPRPVRARRAQPEMFADRPSPDRKMQVRWVDPSDPDFEAAKKLKLLAKGHHVETLALIKKQLEEEEKLAKQQLEMLTANYKKYEMIENVMKDDTLGRLARHYGISLADE